MKTRVISFAVAVVVIAVCFAGCGSSTNGKMYTAPKKIADYFYEIEYTDYRPDTELVTISNAEAFACSSVRNGNFFGRNFDYVYNDTPEFLVRMTATETRHASIGFASHFGLREDKMDTYDKQLELIPNFTYDGINDCGVVCCANVVFIDGGNVITGTNPGKERLHMTFIPRFVLDNASSVDEAVELIKGRDIFGDLNNEEYIHVMIADKDKTCIVEFYNNEVIVEEKTGDEQIMTNYYLNSKKNTDFFVGLERYNILKENYSLGSTFDGMKQLMQKVKYSGCYNVEGDNLWYSEALTPTMDLSKLDKETFVREMTPIALDYWKTRALNDRKTDKLYFQTIHNTTYDMENKKVSVYIQEDYSKEYQFELK